MYFNNYLGTSMLTKIYNLRNSLKFICSVLFLCLIDSLFVGKNAVGIDNRDREGNEEEANVVVGHSLIKTCSPDLLQGKELQAHWFSHS
jgi:hypothetical protein